MPDIEDLIYDAQQTVAREKQNREEGLPLNSSGDIEEDIDNKIADLWLNPGYTIDVIGDALLANDHERFSACMHEYHVSSDPKKKGMWLMEAAKLLMADINREARNLAKKDLGYE